MWRKSMGQGTPNYALHNLGTPLQINPISGGDPGFIRATGMRMTHVWDPVDRNADGFAKKYGVDRGIPAYD